MMRLVITAPVALIAACQSSPPEDSQYIARALVGQWVYESNDHDCRYVYYEAFRSDGTMTSTSSGCDMTSDGFGIFDYGWYVAEGHVCMVHIEEQHKDEKKRPVFYREKFLERVKLGFVESSCRWRVEKVTPTTISIVPRDPALKPFTMKREHWL